MQLLILSLLVAAASATYSYDYSYPHSYGYDSYGSSLYGGYGGYGDSYGYSNLGSGVSYLLGGHGASHYSAPRVHFIRYVPSHTTQVSPSRGKVDFVMGPSALGREAGTKSTPKGSSSVSPQSPPAWITTKGGASQSKISSPSKIEDPSKTPGSKDSVRNPIPSRNKPFFPNPTKVPTPVTPPTPEDIPVTTDFLFDYSDDEEEDFIEEEPENEISEIPRRPEPIVVDKPLSSLIDGDDNSKVNKAFASISSNKRENINPIESGSSSRKPHSNADYTRQSHHDSSSDSNIKTGIASKPSTSKSQTDSAPSSNTKVDPPKNTFRPVPDMDYDDFGHSKNPSNRDDFEQQSHGGFNGNRKTSTPGSSTFPTQTLYNKRPLAAQLMPQTFSFLTSRAFVPDVIVENPALGYYYENHQPPTVTYDYGMPLDANVKFV